MNNYANTPKILISPFVDSLIYVVFGVINIIFLYFFTKFVHSYWWGVNLGGPHAIIVPVSLILFLSYFRFRDFSISSEFRQITALCGGLSVLICVIGFLWIYISGFASCWNGPLTCLGNQHAIQNYVGLYYFCIATLVYIRTNSKVYFASFFILASVILLTAALVTS